MRVRWTDPGVKMEAQRNDVVVCIPLYGGHEYFVGCLRSVLAHTPKQFPIMICDDASPDRRSEHFVRRLAEEVPGDHEIIYVRRQVNGGFAANINAALAAAEPADLVILNSDCVVAAGWIEGLIEAARHDSRVATATTLTNNGTIVSVPGPEPSPRLPANWTLDDAAAAVRNRSLRIRPRLPSAIGHCMLVRRQAVELVGDFDLTFSPGYGEEVDFSQRCLARGLCHVLADDVYVFHHGAASFSTDGQRNPVQDDHERVIAARYPYYHPWIAEIERDTTSPLRRALSSARRILAGVSVVIDGRILAGPMTGTQLQVLEVIAALARSDQAHLAVVVPDQPGEYATSVLDALPHVRTFTRSDVAAGRLPPGDLVHRPYQVSNQEDLAFLASLGERVIVTNQDLISYHNPAYFLSFDAWRAYRRLTRAALALADRVVFISEHARADAMAEDLIEPSRASVVYNGVDHSLSGVDLVATPPAKLVRVPNERELILCLGTNFKHKNRAFALRLLDELRRRHSWDGYLVLAGPAVTHGGSDPEEAELLTLQPGLARSTINLAAVTEAEKQWLYRRASLVLYPTVHEGFGLIPFEAADHDAPTLWAAGTSLTEVLPHDAAQVVGWDAAETADRAVALMRDGELRQRTVEAVREAARRFTWDAAAGKLLDLYTLTCDLPPNPRVGMERQRGLLRAEISEDALRLFGPAGLLPPDVERPLLALATHPQVGKPMFGAIKLAYRASYRWRRRLGGNGVRRSG